MNVNAGKLPEHLAEILEMLWTLEENGGGTADEFLRLKSNVASEEELTELKRLHLITVDETRHVRLKGEGQVIAQGIIRRHRLAERLICDVLGAHVDESEDAACEFEHILAEGITSSICTLLGHPRFCPHGKPIPEGECCRGTQDALRPILVSSDQLEVGEAATIAYLCTAGHARMMKLSSLGITPGNRLRLLQKWPSHVFQCDETEIAVEGDVAKNIYVRRGGRKDGGAPKA